jgi:glycosyltransferase involved in cell wall biosynthesis
MKQTLSISRFNPTLYGNDYYESKQDRIILFLETEWVVGGGSIYNINAGDLLTKRNIGRVKGLSLQALPGVGFVDKIGGSSIHQPSSSLMCSRTRIRYGIKNIATIRPTHIITTISPETCECLRSLPHGVITFGVLHTMDREGLALARLYADQFDKIICVSSELKHLANSIVPELSNKIIIIPPIISTPKPGYYKSTNNTEPLRFLYLGRLEEASKRVKSIPRIAMALKNMGVPFKWTVAGEGKEQQFLESEVNRLHLNKEINIIKPVQPNLIGELFKSHDVIVSTSDSESYGMSVHEAICWGLVPIAGKTLGKLDKTVLAVGGFVVDPNSPEEFAQIMSMLDINRTLLSSLAQRGSNAINDILAKQNDLTDWASCLQAIQKSETTNILQFNLSPLIPIPRHLAKQSLVKKNLSVLLYAILNLIDLVSWRLSDQLLFTLRSMNKSFCLRASISTSHNFIQKPKS